MTWPGGNAKQKLQEQKAQAVVGQMRLLSEVAGLGCPTAAGVDGLVKTVLLALGGVCSIVPEGAP